MRGRLGSGELRRLWVLGMRRGHSTVGFCLGFLSITLDPTGSSTASSPAYPRMHFTCLSSSLEFQSSGHYRGRALASQDRYRTRERFAWVGNHQLYLLTFSFKHLGTQRKLTDRKGRACKGFPSVTPFQASFSPPCSHP